MPAPAFGEAGNGEQSSKLAAAAAVPSTRVKG